MSSEKFTLYKKSEDGTIYIMIQIFNFNFRWFTDCGDWFIYLEHCKKQLHGIRFSSAGFMKY